MSSKPEIYIQQSDIETSLEKFTEIARTSKDEAWRCLYAKMPDSFHISPSNKDFIEEKLEEALDDTDQSEIFWLTSGHLFIFFQGHVTSTLKKLEEFLGHTKGKTQSYKTEYQFFWELNHFWGYFDEVLSQISENNSNNEKKHEPRKSRHRPLLLILEDDRTTRHFIQAMMQDHCDIAVAWNGTQAEQLYKELKPDLAFLDIEVPFGDGDDLATILCKDDPEAFIVMVSGGLNPAIEKRLIDVGVKGFAHKPPDQAILLGFFKQYLLERRAKT